MVVGMDVENSIGCSTCCSDHGVCVCHVGFCQQDLPAPRCIWSAICSPKGCKLHALRNKRSTDIMLACSPHRTIVMLLCHHASHRNSHNHKQNDDGDEGGDDGHDGGVRPPPPPTTTITTKTPPPQPPPTTYSASSASASGCFFLMYI